MTLEFSPAIRAANPPAVTTFRQKYPVRFWFAIAVFVVVANVLSFAPNYRVLSELRGDISPTRGIWRLYAPTNWLIDYTPLRAPLFAWADVWGVRDDFEWAWMCRSDWTDEELEPWLKYHRLR